MVYTYAGVAYCQFPMWRKEGTCLRELEKEKEDGVQFHYGGTGGHFACACVHPLNDSGVGASNLMAGSRKLA